MARASAYVAGVAAALVAGCTGDMALIGAGASPDQAQFDPFRPADESAAGRRQIIENPTLEDVLKPGPLPEMALGRPDAPVTIVKYMSLTCPYCRHFQLKTFPQLKREYIDTGKVRFILREFPIGFQSGAATIALRCAPPARYFELYEKFLTQQAAWVSQEVRRDPIFKIAAQAGLTRAQFDACYENQSMIQALQQIKERGRTLGVIGTPNFFINERLVKKVMDMDDIRQAVDPLLAGRAASAGVSVAN
jgi:protein-disulfide isomerase